MGNHIHISLNLKKKNTLLIHNKLPLYIYKRHGGIFNFTHIFSIYWKCGGRYCTHVHAYDEGENRTLARVKVITIHTHTHRKRTWNNIIIPAIYIEILRRWRWWRIWNALTKICALYIYIVFSTICNKIHTPCPSCI